MERDKIEKPGQPRFNTKLAEHYQASDFYIGATVEFHKHRFVIIDADDYAYNFMERHPDVVNNSEGRAKWTVCWKTPPQ